jgi:hypothetical protein
MLGARRPLGTASATMALAPAVLYDPHALLPAGLVLGTAGTASYLGRRVLWPPDAQECYRLARSAKVYQQTGLRAAAWSHLPGHPKPKLRVRPRADGQHDLWLWEAHDATARTAEPMPAFWSRFLNDLERRTGREWALEDPPGTGWVIFHPAQPLPEPGELQVPTDTLRGGDPLQVPLGTYRNDLGELAELLVNLTAVNFAIAGAPGTGKTALAMFVVGHLLDHLQAGMVDILDVKRTWPWQLADHPRVGARETDDDAIFQRLADAQRVMMTRYTLADTEHLDLPDIVADQGHRFLMVEELSELLDRFGARSKPRNAKVWSPDTPDGFVGAEQVVKVAGSIARMGREAGIHLAPAVAQDWRADQFGTSGGALRRLFAARTSGWQEADGARLFGLPDAARLPLRDQAPIPGRFTLKVEGGLPIRYQAHHRTKAQLAARCPVPA